MLFKSKRSLKCSFCGKFEEKVVKLVAGPRVYICDECVVLASKLMQENSSETGPSDNLPSH